MENIRLLKEKFEIIKKMGYVKGINNSLGGMGTTFEKLISCNSGNFEIPDFEGIEIKTRRSYSKASIGLFSSNPDGKYLFEIERLRKIYGYPAKNDNKYKVLQGDVFGNKKSFIGMNYLFRLDVDWQEEKIFLNIYNKKEELVDHEIFWTFNLLKEKLERKFRLLAIVDVWPSRRSTGMYYNYYKLRIFRLKDFKTFLKLIENGDIYITINISVYFDEKRYGRTNNHGLCFNIPERNLGLLFFKE